MFFIFLGRGKYARYVQFEVFGTTIVQSYILYLTGEKVSQITEVSFGSRPAFLGQPKMSAENRKWNRSKANIFYLKNKCQEMNISFVGTKN